MTPKLIALAGPLRGTVIELTETELTFGRDSDSSIVLADKSVSRQHCQIAQDGEHFLAIDLDSHNGTFINDVPVKEHVLTHGDRIRVGASYFLALMHEEELQTSCEKVEYDNDNLPTASLRTFRVEEALYATTRDLNVLMKISTNLGSTKSLRPLQAILMDSLFEVVPAERGVISLTAAAPNYPNDIYAADRAQGPLESIRLSRTVTNCVLNEGMAVLSGDLLMSADLGRVNSLIASSIRSLLCVPLIRADRVTGFIYLDTSKEQSRFDEGHLRIVTIIAGIAAGALERAAEIDRLGIENERLRREQRAAKTIVGESEAMKHAYDFIARVAGRNSTVLILGESGTGKELAAREIHNLSSRANGPFIAVNCASLSEALLESDLFGHERGAFTGAVNQKKGKLEAANGGALFLDEVGEIPAAVQTKLLRVLQDFQFERLGSTRSIKVDVRLIAATNRNLEAAVASGTFRSDLYYRLNVVQLTMPPLRDRREDISLLANYFVAKYAEKCNRQVAGLSSAAHRCLMAYDWPGNVRELQNAIEHAVVLGSSDTVELEDLPDVIMGADVAKSDRSASSYQALVREAKREILLRAIERAGNYSSAARRLGVHPNNLHRLMRSVGLKSSAHETSS